MHIEFVEIQNFRRLKAIRIDFTKQTTLLVGANNSGKTSAIDALGWFLDNPRRFDANDFTASNWALVNKIGTEFEAAASGSSSTGPSLVDWEPVLPCLDLWLRVDEDEIHYVNHLLPTLDWEGGLLGVRLRYEPTNVEELSSQYLAARKKVSETIDAVQKGGGSNVQTPVLWPGTMHEFLERRLRKYFAIRAYPLDPAKQVPPKDGVAQPQPLPAGSEPIEGDALKGLVRIDVIYAQRDFADVSANREGLEGVERISGQRLTQQLRSYYSKHLNPKESPEPSDLDALQAIQEAEKLFDGKLKISFAPALKQVENLGYPGLSDPRLIIATKISLTDGLNHDAAVQYQLVPESGAASGSLLCLPESYNGLGYQNLISMVFRLISFRDAWMQVGKAAAVASAAGGEGLSPAPLHLVLVEEPEAHLHAQVQQVFIRKAYDLLRDHSNLGENTKLSTQLVVSTHSSHVAHECDFSCIRYFRRRPASNQDKVPTATVVNLSEVFGCVTDTQRFVTRYLKVTHCDLFFADAAILIEGPAERMLVPHFISRETEFKGLSQCYITLLEIGGSHAHRLKSLIQKLGLITLVVTDLDAMEPSKEAAVAPVRGNGQVSRNATLNTWIPRKGSLDELLDVPAEQKVEKYDEFFSVCVAYQFPLQVTLKEGSSPVEMLPNTFEDALVYDNLQVFRSLDGTGSIKRFREAVNRDSTAGELAEEMFAILRTAKKAEFALDLLELKQEPWPIVCPTYIREGLLWLQEKIRQKQQETLSDSEEQKTPDLVQK